MHLYEIEQAILDCIDESGEVIDFEKLMELDIAKKTKIDNIICLYKSHTAFAAAIDKEIDILTERKKRAENEAENLRQWISEILGGEKFESARNKVTWRASDEVKLLDESIIPDEYKTTETKIKISKNDIKKAIKDGVAVDGAELIEKNNIQIK